MLVFGLKESLVECATVFFKSEVILIQLEAENNPNIGDDESSNNDYSDKDLDEISDIKSEPIEDIVVEPLIENTDEKIDDSNLSCKQCEFVCELKTSLNRHTMTFHGDRKYFDSAFKCKICGNGYKSNEGLATHFSYEHEKTPYKCSKLELKNPNSEVHEGFFTYQCHMCNYGSNYKESLKAHLNLVHKQSEAEIATVHGKRKTAKKPSQELQVDSIQPKKSEFEEELTENANVTNYR